MNDSVRVSPDELRRLVRRAQRAAGVPGVAAVVSRDGSPVWLGGAGVADIDRGDAADTADVQYRIGSITKTFTAATVLLLVADGAIALDAPLGHYVAGTPFDGSTIRQLLSHTGGVQREAPGQLWSTGLGPTAAELRRDLGAADPMAAPGDRWHYSNLGYALLGLVVSETTGVSCQQAVDQRLLEPLGLSRTTWKPVPPAATGYVRRPHQDSVEVARDMDQRAVGVGGQLWSTLRDLVVWADALAGNRPDIVPVTVVDRMHTVHAVTDPAWTSAWGLGLTLSRFHGHAFSGHTGAIDGFLAGLTLHRATRTAAIVLANATAGIDTGELAAQLLRHAVEAVEPELPAWRAGVRCPRPIAELLGGWWAEGTETTFVWHAGHLHAHLTADPSARSVFVQVAEDEFRVDDGRLLGERLLVERSGGVPSALVWATYRYRRAQS